MEEQEEGQGVVLVRRRVGIFPLHQVIGFAVTTILHPATAETSCRHRATAEMTHPRPGTTAKILQQQQ